jgi:hypothetical protein
VPGVYLVAQAAPEAAHATQDAALSARLRRLWMREPRELRVEIQALELLPEIEPLDGSLDLPDVELRRLLAKARHLSLLDALDDRQNPLARETGAEPLVVLIVHARSIGQARTARAGRAYDPEKLDLAAVNKRPAALSRRFARRRR